MAGNSNLIQNLAGTLIQIQNYALKTRTVFSAILDKQLCFPFTVVSECNLKSLDSFSFLKSIA